MADPVPIVRTLRTTPEISRRFSLNGVVTLVDAKNVLTRLRELDAADDDAPVDAPPDEAFQQIMFADRTVLNKVRPRLADVLAYPRAHAGMPVWSYTKTREGMEGSVDESMDDSSMDDSSMD